VVADGGGPRTFALTGSASGMGAATVARLRADGHRVIGVDLHDADVVADLGTLEGREDAVGSVMRLADGPLDGLVTWAGLPGLSDGSGARLAAVNFFGTVTLMEGLRPALCGSSAPAAVAVSSNSTTCQPGIPVDVAEACMSGDEATACDLAERAGAMATYAATKLAIARWVRVHAVQSEWAGEGITLNAVVPGAVETPLLDATRADPVIGPFVDDFPVPLGRTGDPAELAAFVCFLLGPEARWFCGSVLFCDGGTDALLRPDAVPPPM
jgi:NAD(P)-dependent dehydrogenase (short-subunit alcohol dehydrogenase family)